eukprot:TRINITY_DN20389_c0_g1_i1.p1 TRINITY_DN20389_c0_g1~~TRINITY_DN20389_c0_g1_i1.p1  ORF type:complete len:655 (+),score=80.31 TRINITY_DN20389_c0_g1_i1:171-1967(+)
MRAHSSSLPYLVDGQHDPSYAIVAFPESWSVDDWFSTEKAAFGDTKIDLSLFPSLKGIGNDETSVVNGAFLRQFDKTLKNSLLQEEVRKLMAEKKQIVFTGHSSGGSIAILATLWLLEQHLKFDNPNQILPLCVTFGSPLVGDHLLGRAVRREDWSSRFIHFVMRYDIVPRILLSPFSSIQREFQTILLFLDPKSTYFRSESIESCHQPTSFVSTIMRNALFVASHAACLSMGCTNLLLESITGVIHLSPYRPFGTYVFCTGNGRLVSVSNPDAVLQMLFYCLQLGPEQEVVDVAFRSLVEHLVYESELRDSLEMQDVVYLDRLEEIPLSSEDNASNEMQAINMALKDLGLSTKARLCLHAAGELEKQKLKNQEKAKTNCKKIQEGHNFLFDYRAKCELRGVSYYDAFKLQKDIEDFDANVKRLELAGLWDEIIDMLKRYELPDSFERQTEWVNLGTTYRRLLEPLDIANYYRHFKNEDTGPYMVKGRPQRYRYTQRWLERASKLIAGSSSDSCFWAKIEEFCVETSENKPFEEMKVRVVELEKEVLGWVSRGDLRKDVFLKGSTFVKWWMALPQQHRSVSLIERLIHEDRWNMPMFC